MPIRLLDTAYADVRAADLSLRLDEPARPTLAALTVPLPDGVLELGVLGASHQVRLALGGATLLETVACLPGDGSLPARHEAAVLPDAAYRFRSRVRRLEPGAFARALRRLRRIARHPGSIAGVFPGEPDALTVLVAAAGDDAVVAWRTWHVYPGSGEIVSTASEVRAG
jgi:hypothetical protein